MAYFRRVPPVRVDLATDPRYWVEIRDHLVWGDEQRRAAEYIEVVREDRIGANGDAANDSVLRRTWRLDKLNMATLRAAIVGWNLDHETGEVDADGEPIVEPLPFTPETLAWAIENFEPVDADHILEEVNRRIRAPRTPTEQATEKNGSPSPSSRRSRTART